MDTTAVQSGDHTETFHADENIDWHTSLKDVYHTLADPKAPDDAKRDAALRYGSRQYPAIRDDVYMYSFD
jgi:hypothetical protein